MILRTQSSLRVTNPANQTHVSLRVMNPANQTHVWGWPHLCNIPTGGFFVFYLSFSSGMVGLVERQFRLTQIYENDSDQAMVKEKRGIVGIMRTEG